LSISRDTGVDWKSSTFEGGEKVPVFEILCLANSVKYQGRCIAGVCLDDGKWIRPVSDNAEARGALFGSQYRYDDGREVLPLEVAKREFLKPCPKDHQSENWLIGSEPWTRGTPLDEEELLDFLEDCLSWNPLLFGNASDCLTLAEFRRRPPRSSLLLVEPEELRLRLVRRREGFQTRARFLLGDERYDLVVTDPIYREHMERFPPEEEYPFTQVVSLAPGARVFLTISLGEEFRGAFYKLVAAIIVFPPQAVRWRGIC